MANEEELIAQFTSITAMDTNRAKFYLQASNWELNTALSSYYESDGTHDNPIDLSPEVQPTSAPTPSLGNVKDNKMSTSQSRLGTIHTLPHSDSNSSSEEEGEAFYAGGSERSGQQVLGPPKKKDIVADMFKSAKEHGAEVVDMTKGSSSNPRLSVTFSGTGYRLGQTPDNTEVVGGPSNSKEKDSTPREITLKLWKNGFSVDDDPVRDYSDPTNRAFLDSVKEGVIPRELLDRAQGNEVQLNMEDHRHEDFIVKKQSVRAFTGEGQMLGSPVPTIIGSTGPASENDRIANLKEAQAGVNVDLNQPITNIQIRLSDGGRLVGQFNHTHTIGDVRIFVIAARPQYSLATFSLMTTFPNCELSDSTKTLKDANLLGAAIHLRLK